MGTTLTCDFVVDGQPCGKRAPVKLDMVNSSRVFTMLACREHSDAVESAMVTIGFQVTTKTDDKLRKGYITESGKPFSAQEARDWLTRNGHNVPLAGRLSKELIEVYRANN